MAASAARRLADHRRPLASPTWCSGCRTGTGRGTGPARRCGRPPGRPRSSTTCRDVRPAGQAADARRGLRAGPDRARGRPRVARRRPGAGRGHPRTTRRPGDRRGGPQHQPPGRPHAEPARAVLPADGQRPHPDDRPRVLPAPGQRSDHADSPRVGDGFVRVDATGRVVYASPNALSVFRRLGLGTDLTGLNLAELTRELVPAAAPARRGDAQRGARRPDASRHRDLAPTTWR